jgi:predicted transcriptional regulator
MPNKLRTFKLSDELMAKLDAIAACLPRSSSGMPATRTDAVNAAVDRFYAELAERHDRQS